MNKYNLGERVLIASDGTEHVILIDGVKWELENGKVTVSYRSTGCLWWQETSVLGRVTIERTKQTRTRKSKERTQDTLSLTETTTVRDGESGTTTYANGAT